MKELMHVLLSFAVKQRPDTAPHENGKFVLHERRPLSAFVNADSTWAPVSPSSSLLAGDHTGSASVTGPLKQSPSKEAPLQPGAFLQEDAAQPESIRRRLHQASSAAAGSSFILVCFTLIPLFIFLLIVIRQFASLLIMTYDK